MELAVPKISAIDLLSCLTQSGRRKLARKLLQPYAQIPVLSELVANGVSEALNAGLDRMSDERCGQLAEGCKVLSTACDLVRTSVDPSGEGGKSISTGERVLIASSIQLGLSNVLTQDAIDEKIEQLIQKVP